MSTLKESLAQLANTSENVDEAAFATKLVKLADRFKAGEITKEDVKSKFYELAKAHMHFGVQKSDNYETLWGKYFSRPGNKVDTPNDVFINDLLA